MKFLLSTYPYISTDEGWLYLAGLKDLFNGELVGYSQLKYWQEIQLKRLEQGLEKDDLVRKEPDDFSAAIFHLFGRNSCRKGLDALG